MKRLPARAGSFFAPADGICWVEADLTATTPAEDVKVHQISLGKQ